MGSHSPEIIEIYRCRFYIFYDHLWHPCFAQHWTVQSSSSCGTNSTTMDVAGASHAIQGSLKQAGSAAVEAIKHTLPNGFKSNSNGTATTHSTDTATVKDVAAAASSAPTLSPKMAATRKPLPCLLHVTWTRHYLGGSLGMCLVQGANCAQPFLLPICVVRTPCRQGARTGTAASSTLNYLPLAHCCCVPRKGVCGCPGPLAECLHARHAGATCG
jgi:hypothetical protein